MTAQIKARYPTSAVYARPGTFQPKALANNCVGAYLFCQKPGWTQAEAAKWSSWNRAPAPPGAANDMLSRRKQWPGGYPTFFSNHATFREDTPLLTNIPDFGPNGGCLFAICRCDDDSVGTLSVDRAFIAGNYAGNTNKGFGLEYASDAASTVRALDFDAAGVVQQNQMDLGTSSSDFEKIRVLYAETGRASGGNKVLAAVNLSGDGTTPDPSDTTLVGGRSVGSQTFSIGGRIADSSAIYTPSITKDIACVVIFNALPDTTERATLYAQMQGIAADMAITLLSSTW